MKWYTCIVHIENHVTPTHMLCTRADSPLAAAKKAKKWFVEPDFPKADQVDVAFVFEGRLIASTPDIPDGKPAAASEGRGDSTQQEDNHVD